MISVYVCIIACGEIHDKDSCVAAGLLVYLKPVHGAAQEQVLMSRAQQNLSAIIERKKKENEYFFHNFGQTTEEKVAKVKTQAIQSAKDKVLRENTIKFGSLKEFLKIAKEKNNPARVHMLTAHHLCKITRNKQRKLVYKLFIFFHFLISLILTFACSAY